MQKWVSSNKNQKDKSAFIFLGALFLLLLSSCTIETQILTESKGMAVNALASLSGLPASLSSSSVLDITVGGEGIVGYKYKLAPKDGLDCTVESAYSSERSLEEKINDDLTVWPEKELKLCVIGKNNLGVWQEVAFPTEFSWYFDNIAPLTATDLDWAETWPTNSEMLHAKWEISTSTDLAEQKIRIYEAIACVTSPVFEASLEKNVTGYTVDILDLFFSKANANGKILSYQIESVDVAGNATSVCSSGLMLDYEAPVVTLAGMPAGSSAKYILDITSGGTGVVAYKYKLGSAAAADCTDSSGYSASEIDVATKITDNISSYSNGAIKVCAVGKDAAGNWQKYTDATTATWNKASPNISFSLSSSSISEYDSPFHTVEVSLSSAVDIDVSVSYAFSETGTYPAINGLDYTGTNGALTILAGSTAKSFTIPVLDDNIDEYDETFKIDLSNPIGASLGGVTTHTVTVQDDDDIPLLSVQDVFVIEGATTSLRANLSSPTEKGDVTLAWSVDAVCVGSNCAVSPTHYTISPTSGTATIPKGQTYIDFAAVTTVDNVADEPFRRIPIKLNSASGAHLYGTSADVYINDNDVPTGKDFIQLSVANLYTCGVTSSGKVYCWGVNQDYQLGQGDYLPKVGPVEVTGFGGEAIKKVSALFASSCALTHGTGRIYCWGLGSHSTAGGGAMGNGTSLTNKTPGLVSDPSGVGDFLGVSDIGIGMAYGCALKLGAVYCWGTSKFYTTARTPIDEDALIPVVMGSPLDSGIESISVGYQHACAIKSESGLKKVYCWGINNHGQLGRGTVSDGEHIPSAVVGITDAKNVWTGYSNTCVQRISGKVLCFGQNSYNILSSTNGNVLTPVEIPELQDATLVELADAAICGLASGELRCRGLNDNGGLGTNWAGGKSQDAFETMVGAESQVSSVSLAKGSGYTTCFIRQGQVFCTGLGGFGQLGDGIQSYVSPPEKAVLFSDANLPSQISAADAHVCGLFTEGVKCWGHANSFRTGNLLNNGTYILPTPVKNLESGVQKISTSRMGSCALKDSGALLCWGNYLSRGIESTSSSGNPVSPLGLGEGVTDVFGGTAAGHCAIKDGNLYCWGENPFGELGTGDSVGRKTPILIGNGFVKAAFGDHYLCLLKADNTVWCSGRNHAGQLGLGDTINRNTFSQVSLPAGGIKDLVLAGTASCVHFEDDRVECWGSRAGKPGLQLSPVPVVELGTDVLKISAASANVCALMKNKTLKCWGSNNFGQFGVAPSGDFASPTEMAQFNSYGEIDDVFVSGMIICAKVSTEWYCAGRNSYSQLGLGTKPYRLAPISINPL